MAVANAPTYHFTAIITAVVQTPGVNVIKLSTFETEAPPQIS